MTTKVRTKLFPKEDLQGLLWDEEIEGMEVLSDEITGTSRWSVHHELIFKAGVVCYLVDYSVGATEQQCEQPFEYEDEYISCTEVRPVEKITIVYEAVRD